MASQGAYNLNEAYTHWGHLGYNSAKSPTTLWVCNVNLNKTIRWKQRSQFCFWFLCCLSKGQLSMQPMFSFPQIPHTQWFCLFVFIDIDSHREAWLEVVITYLQGRKCRDWLPLHCYTGRKVRINPRKKKKKEAFMYFHYPSVQLYACFVLLRVSTFIIG